MSTDSETPHEPRWYSERWHRENEYEMRVCRTCGQSEDVHVRKPEAAPSDTDQVDRLAVVLIEAWSKAEPDSPVTKHPASYVATFADMARAVLSRTSQPVQVTPGALAAKLYSIEYQVDPDSATTDDVDERLGAADDLIAWFAEHAPSQPVQVEVTEDIRMREWNAFMGDFYAAEGASETVEAQQDFVCFNAGWIAAIAALGGGDL